MAKRRPAEDFGKYRKREIARAHRAAERKKLAELRARVRRAKAARREALRQVVARGKATRRRMRGRWKALRAAARERINREIATEREQMRARHNRRKERIRAEHTQKISKAQALLAEERRWQREQRSFAKRASAKERARRTAAEARAESDDRVEANLATAPELVPVWRKVKRRIAARPRMSRTEAFLHWVEENPDEVLTIRADYDDREIAKMAKEYEDAQAELERYEMAGDIRKAGGALGLDQEAAELERELADVPF
ncbi:MAG: hypothetical protein JSV86_18525 [Gemmatimonadota bacterium]|nr:MAG: hypothetical protein JSV86_18525 [Gemmatimonadota bacterium]